MTNIRYGERRGCLWVTFHLRKWGRGIGIKYQGCATLADMNVISFICAIIAITSQSNGKSDNWSCQKFDSDALSAGLPCIQNINCLHNLRVEFKNHRNRVVCYYLKTPCTLFSVDRDRDVECRCTICTLYLCSTNQNKIGVGKSIPET